MGCGSSTPAADAERATSSAQPVPSAAAGAVKRAAESLSPAAFRSLLSDFAANAARGVFWDTYELGTVLGALLVALFLLEWLTV